MCGNNQRRSWHGLLPVKIIFSGHTYVQTSGWPPQLQTQLLMGDYTFAGELSVQAVVSTPNACKAIANEKIQDYRQMGTFHAPAKGLASLQFASARRKPIVGCDCFPARSPYETHYVLLRLCNTCRFSRSFIVTQQISNRLFSLSPSAFPSCHYLVSLRHSQASDRLLSDWNMPPRRTRASVRAAAAPAPAGANNMPSQPPQQQQPAPSDKGNSRKRLCSSAHAPPPPGLWAGMPTETLAAALRCLNACDLAIARCVCSLFRDAASSVLVTEERFQTARLTLSPDGIA